MKWQRITVMVSVLGVILCLVILRICSFEQDNIKMKEALQIETSGEPIDKAKIGANRFGSVQAINPSRDSDSASLQNSADLKSDPLVKKFGEKQIEPIVNEHSILFLEGKYIESPYLISRKGLQIHINGHLVDEIDWPGDYYLAEDPILPMGLSKNSSFSALSDKDWINKKARYLHSHFPPDMAQQRYLEAPFPQVVKTFWRNFLVAVSGRRSGGRGRAV